MTSTPRPRRRWRMWLCPLLSGAVLGCTPGGTWRTQNPPDVPPGAIPAPNGSYVREWTDRQTNKAEADDFVIYLYEWYKHGPELGPFGTYHVDRITRRLAEMPFPVLIQVSGDPKLDEARRIKVVSILATAGYADANARVIIGFPTPSGLYGEEAEPIYGGFLRRSGGGGGFGFSGLGNSFSGSQTGSGFGGGGGIGRGGFGGGFGGGGFAR